MMEIVYTVTYRKVNDEDSDVFGGYFGSFQVANSYVKKWALDEWGEGNFFTIEPSLYIYELEYIEVELRKSFF